LPTGRLAATAILRKQRAKRQERDPLSMRDTRGRYISRVTGPPTPLITCMIRSSSSFAVHPLLQKAAGDSHVGSTMLKTNVGLLQHWSDVPDHAMLLTALALIGRLMQEVGTRSVWCGPLPRFRLSNWPIDLRHTCAQHAKSCVMSSVGVFTGSIIVSVWAALRSPVRSPKKAHSLMV
jgi:hypothetical protein